MKGVKVLAAVLVAAALQTFGMGLPPAMIPVPGSTDSNSWWQIRRQSRLKANAESSDAQVVFYGDSITELWEWDKRGLPVWNEHFKEGPYKAVEFGYSGDCTQNLIWRMQNGEGLGINPKVVVLQIGTNNSWLHPEYSAIDTILGIRQVLEEAKNRFPGAKIILCPIPPCGEKPDDKRRIKNDAINAELPRFCNEETIFFLDWAKAEVRPDGTLDGYYTYDFVHPTTEGYKLWYARLEPYLKRFIGEDGSKHSTVRPISRLGEEWWAKRLLERRMQIGANTNMYFNVVFCGDSITHFWESAGKKVMADNFSEYSVLNLGYSGDLTQHLLWRLKNGELDGYKAGLFVMMIGTNNTFDKAEEVAAGIKACLDTILEKHPEAKVLLLPIFPRDREVTAQRRVKNNKVNDIIRSYADNEQVITTDFNIKFLNDNGELIPELMPDMLHPSDKGYVIWAESIKNLVENNAGDPRPVPKAQK